VPIPRSAIDTPSPLTAIDTPSPLATIDALAVGAKIGLTVRRTETMTGPRYSERSLAAGLCALAHPEEFKIAGRRLDLFKHKEFLF
jgi:hypothetical protein